ncbi:MAG: allophanate hydrolase [Pseudomonadota bacterium]|nr:allophanate hydrolase [Pseudomonadota bacterium]
MKSLPFTLPALKAAYAAGTRPEDVVAEVYARIRAVDDPGIFIHLAEEQEVRAAARGLGAYDPALPLWGVPFAIKDNIDAAGMPTTAACPAFAYEAGEDAFILAQLRAAGAILIGKTNLDQFATGLVGVRSPYTPPKNAVDPAMAPGGSSSGSAVAVGHGIVAFALGTDTAGSGRVPAALNNIVGLKPTLGAFSASGVVPACRSIETVSVFALTVEDAYEVFRVAAVYDPADAYARPVAAPPPGPTPPHAVIGIPTPGSIRFFGDQVQQASFNDAVEILRGAGATVKEVDFAPLYAVAEMLYDGAWVAERYTVIEDLLKTDPEAILPVTRQIITHAESLTAADAFRGMYRLKELIRQAEPLLAGIDALCVPTMPTFVSVADLQADPITPNSRSGTYTNFVNLMDMCGLAVPIPPRSDGRPGGVTLLARAGQDGYLAALAAPLEAAGTRTLGATDWPVPARAEAVPTAAPDEIALAVCGAHMSGLPLNKELTGRGARFLKTTRSSPDYRFYALAGGPPARPGMVRCADGEGAAIAMEVWALPLSEFGGFMAGIPAPLGIGTVRLEDGSTVKGFVCEAIGTEGAEDITEIADWRAFLGR